MTFDAENLDHRHLRKHHVLRKCGTQTMKAFLLGRAEHAACEHRPFICLVLDASRREEVQLQQYHCSADQYETGDPVR
jgi:hypothetical protein